MEKEEELSLISNQLLLNGTLTKCPSLLHGKMGISIFFFHYARYVQDDLYSEYAMDLIRGLLEQLHANYRADYEKGIAGIGVGFSYLLEKRFLDLEEEAFDDFDERMYGMILVLISAVMRECVDMGNIGSLDYGEISLPSGHWIVCRKSWNGSRWHRKN